MALKRAVLVDLDNTLYNWVDYFAPAFRAMVHVLSPQLGVSEQQLTEEFRSVYKKVGSTEYPFSVQLLSSVSTLSSRNQEELMALANTVFGTSRRKRLKAYPTVKSTLQWVRQQGLEVVVVTSGPATVVAPKLNQLGLLSLTSLIIAWEGFELPKDDLIRDKIASSVVRRRIRTELLGKWAFTPKAAAFERALAILGIKPEEAVVVGDSLRSDIEPAIESGIPALWAKYGLEFDLRNRKTIEQLTPGGAEAVNRAYSAGPIPKAVEVLSELADIKTLIEVPQPSMF